jgi:hypothetical protein
MKKKIVVPYFPTGIKYSAPLIILVGMYLLFTGHFVWAFVLILLGIIILTTKYVTEINLSEKYYEDYLFFLGLKVQPEMNRFNAVDRIIVTKGSYSQRVVSRIQSRQINWSEYTATLLFDSGDSLDLLSVQDKHDLIKSLKDYADFLKVGVEDRTTPRHYWVDIENV